MDFWTIVLAVAVGNAVSTVLAAALHAAALWAGKRLGVR